MRPITNVLDVLNLVIRFSLSKKARDTRYQLIGY